MKIQKPASQHTFQQIDLIKQKHNNENATTQQTIKPEPKVLKQRAIVKSCGEAAANAKQMI